MILLLKFAAWCWFIMYAVPKSLDWLAALWNGRHA